MPTSRIELTGPLPLFTFTLTILAIVLSLGMILRLFYNRIPGKIHSLVFATQIFNLVWHSLGIYTTFINFGPTVINLFHFWTGCTLLLLTYITQWEVLRLFESVTLISSKKITNWEIGSISFFVILAMSSFLPKVGLLVPEWSLYWLVVWLQYTCIVTIWIKVTITIKLYKSMRLLKGIQSYQLKKSYKRLIYQNIAMWFWEPVLGYLWAHGWVFEQDLVKRMCFLKIGEASATYHTLMIVLFLNVITKFRFGDKQKQVVHSPVMVAMTVTDHPTPDTKVAE